MSATNPLHVEGISFKPCAAGEVSSVASPCLTCAVERRCLPAGANPVRQLSLQPVAIGAVGGGSAAGWFQGYFLVRLQGRALL